MYKSFLIIYTSIFLMFNELTVLKNNGTSKIEYPVLISELDSIQGNYQYLYSYLSKPDTLYIFETRSNWWGSEQIRFISIHLGNIKKGYLFTANNFDKMLISRNLMPIDSSGNMSRVIFEKISKNDNKTIKYLRKSKLFLKQFKEYSFCEEDTDDGDHILLSVYTKTGMLTKNVYSPDKRKIKNKECIFYKIILNSKKRIDKSLPNYNKYYNSFLEKQKVMTDKIE